jgi:hypothetical protein
MVLQSACYSGLADPKSLEAGCLVRPIGSNPRLNWNSQSTRRCYPPEDMRRAKGFAATSTGLRRIAIGGAVIRASSGTSNDALVGATPRRI